MNTVEKPDLHGGNVEKYLLKEQTHAVIGCAFEVLNQLGHGLSEKCYENALAVEFRLRNIPFEQQRPVEVIYKNVPIGVFVPDMIVYDKIVVDAKIVEQISDHERGQVLNYLRLTKKSIGLILNFKHARMDWERVILS